MLTSNKKIIKIIMLIFCILAFYCIKSNAVVKPTTNFYVNDYANVLTEETEEYIMKTNIELNNKTKVQIVVVTVKTLDGESIEEYATKLFREFEIGDKEKNNGVLLLCSIGDRLFRIEVGYGLEGILPDGKTGRIQDQYIIPYLKNNNYDEGIKNGFSAILEEVCKEYGTKIELQEAKKANETNGLIGLFLLSFIISTIFISTLEEDKKHKNNRIKKKKQKNIFIFFSIYIILSVILNSYICYKLAQFNITIVEKLLYIITYGSFLIIAFIISIIEFYEFKTGKTLKIAGVPVINTNGKSGGGGHSSGGFSGGGGSSRRSEEVQGAFRNIPKLDIFDIKFK